LIIQIHDLKGQYEIAKVQLNKPNPILLVRTNNRLKEFEEILLDNTLVKVQNQALGNKNPEWKEWCQIVQEFIEEQIQESMEPAHFDKQNYQPELHTYRTTFLDFKYGPLSFVYVKIGTSSKVLTMSSMVQPNAITKSLNPLRGGTCLKIIPLHVWTFSILV